MLRTIGNFLLNKDAVVFGCLPFQWISVVDIFSFPPVHFIFVWKILNRINSVIASKHLQRVFLKGIQMTILLRIKEIFINWRLSASNKILDLLVMKNEKKTR